MAPLSAFSGGEDSTLYVGGRGGVTDPIAVTAVPFSNTNYGFDPSSENNYGLGPDFQSTAVIRTVAKAQSTKPSLWWAVLLILVWAVWK